MSMTINLVEDHNIYLCEGGPVYNGGVQPITYLTQWKIVGNSEVHGQEIWSCGEYNPIDGKYHILVQPQGGSIADIALTEPLRKVNNIADTIEFPAALEAFCNTDGSQILTTLPDDTILHIKQFVKNGDFSDGRTEWRNGTSHTSCDYSQNKAVISNIEVGHGYNFGIIQDIRSNIVIGNSYYFKYNAIPCKDIVLSADFSNRSNTRVSCVGNTDNIVSDVVIPASLNQFYLGFSPTTDYEIGDTTEVDNVVSFNLDVMFADCPSLKPSTASDFEALFTNINYIAYSDTAIDVIVKDGKLYKYVDTEGKALVTRNTRNIDLGTCTYGSVTNGFYSDNIKSLALKPQSGQSMDVLCTAYPNSERTWVAGCMGITSSGSIWIGDKSYESATAIKNALAGVEMIYKLATPTTELVDAPQIQEADSYTCVISQGAKAVSWSSFTTE